MDNQNAVSVNLCPICGTPPLIFVYSNGEATCTCADSECIFCDIEDASSWLDALQQWNENTAKAYVERPENPISDNSKHEPADVENGAQNGLDCADTRYQFNDCNLSTTVDKQVEQVDTREKLEDEISEWCASSNAVFARSRFNRIIEWLDRQAAIIEQQLSESEAWRLGITRDAIEHGLTVEIFGVKYAPYAVVERLTDENDQLRRRLERQANNFLKLEHENAMLRDTLERVRELVGDA